MGDPTCPICGESFSSQYEVDIHVQKYHPTPPPPPPPPPPTEPTPTAEGATCPICGEWFSTQHEVDVHVEKYHPTPVPALVPTAEAEPGAFTWNGCKAVYCYGNQVNLDAVKAAGFNTLICYSYGHTLLDEALSKGLWIIPYLGGGNVSYVNQWKHHPAIGAWYFLDEPEYRGHSIAQQQSWYNALKAADPNRDFLTIFSTHGGNYEGVNYFSRSAFDHCGINVYPFNDECFRYGAGEWNGDWVGYLTYCLNRYNAFSGGIGGMAVVQAYYDPPELLNPAGHIKAMLQVFQGLGIGTQAGGYALYIAHGGEAGIFQDPVLRAEVASMNPTYNWPHAPPQPITEYVCPYCGAAFTSQAGLDTHIASVHPTETFTTQDITCSQCGSTLRVTISSISANNVSQNCGVCGLSEIAEGTKIEIIYAEPWPPPIFTCPECGATFASQAELDSHIASEHPPIPPPPPYEEQIAELTAQIADLQDRIAELQAEEADIAIIEELQTTIAGLQAELEELRAEQVAAEPKPWYKKWQTYLLLGGLGTLIGGIVIKKRVAKP